LISFKRVLLRSLSLSWVFLLVLSFGIVQAQEPHSLRSDVLQAMHWRSIGPAVMGGRIADIAVDPKNPYTIYVALATGGVIKSTNDGNTWTPIFDHEAVGSVGAVAVAPSDPNIVWVGTGEANGRNSSSWGDGVYKSTDGGKTWQHMGLDDTREIGRIVVDPNNSNIVYVAAAGRLWGYNSERGLFKTSDGGKTWQKVLYINEKTGVIDVALAGKGGDVLLAAAYRRLRTPWGFYDESSDSGIYRSTDGGKTWSKITKGLPTERVGRIGLSVCASQPNIVYAVVACNEGGAKDLFDPTSNFGGVFRSDDAGATWKRVNSTVPRGFYFGQIRVDPADPNRVYVCGFGLEVSQDGGKHFAIPGYGSPGVHPDLHALWIDPQHPEHMWLGTDGGLYVTHDRGSTWEFVNNFPMGEFYEVSVDNQKPFWVYGGLQDNGCWTGPSATTNERGITNCDWISFPSGDGFYVLSDPDDPQIVYAESQNGEAYRLDRHTMNFRRMHPIAPEGEPDYRFNWNTPLAISPFDHDVVYMGGNHLFRFYDGCKYYDVISPDLSKQEGPHITTTGSGAEIYGTIVTISPSPLQRGLVWVGTDDGSVQLTQDEGKTWENVTDNLPEKVRNYWVSRVLASQFVAGRAYVAIDGHRSDDLAPYLFVTEDYGKTWHSIVGNLPKEGPIQAFREDPVNPNLLFCGTEFGAWVSLDRGQHWQKLGDNLPTVAVDDLAVQSRDHALVAATHGRSLWVLDNIAPLETVASNPKEDQPILFPMSPALEYRYTLTTEISGQHDFVAPNPPRGVRIVFWLPTLEDATPTVVITDAANKEVARLFGERYPGMQTLIWDMLQRQEEERGSGRRGVPPRFVKPGVYTVTLQVGKFKQSQKVTIAGNPALSEEETDEPYADPDSGGENEIGP
jgi:photosystem II stability/assembly factor-like uncharacterized protein